MALDNATVVEDFRCINGSVNSHDGDSSRGSVLLDNNGNESENPENVLLEDLDSYLEDIDSRLTISRMVSDSVIKGMVNAVEQEATEKIAQKEMELAKLKETLYIYHVGSEENRLNGSLDMQLEPRRSEDEQCASLLDDSFRHGGSAESLGGLKIVAKENMKFLRKEIDHIRANCFTRKVSSGSEPVGLGGILENKVPEIEWIDMDNSLTSLETTINSICKNVDNVVNLSKASLHQWQQEKEFVGDIEDMVIRTCIRSLTEELEQKLWDQNARLYDNERVKWLERIREISSLRQELDAVSKALAVPDIGSMTYQGSMEIFEEGDNNKNHDNLHRKVSGNHVSLSPSTWEGNGKRDETVISTPENLDFLQLKHMKKEELTAYFKAEMTKMKRNHEHRVQEMTEEYFGLRRQYLKEKGSSMPFKKDKDFDTLRKKIPTAISKLDDILVENEKLPALGKNGESLCSLEKRLDILLSENRQLKSLVADKKREIKTLSSQVSSTAEIVSRHTLVEASLVKRIGNLQCALEDAYFEASISENVYKSTLKELVHSSENFMAESYLDNKLQQEVYEAVIKEVAQHAHYTSKPKFEESDVEVFIVQGLSAIIFREALKEAQQKLSDFDMKYKSENDIRLSIEMELSQKENALGLEVAEKERLKQEILFLTSLIEKKEKLVKEADIALMKENEQLKSVSQELNDLREEINGQQMLISESRKESDAMKGDLAKALEQLKCYKLEAQELKQKHEVALKELREANDERRMLLAVTEERQKAILLIEAKEKEHEKKLQSLTILVNVLSKAIADFECRVMEDIKRSNLRLDNLNSQSGDLIQNAKIMKRTGLMYKQKLEKRCSDLEKAEAEVDLLGDEVETLLSLLEKIYIALDHYSPILHHYPGITEILKLVRKELGGESARLV